MNVSSSKSKNVLYQNIEERTSATNEKCFNYLFISFIASFAIISLEINGHSLSFYRWDWIQIPIGLHVFFTSLAILCIICKSQTSNQSKADVMVSVPSIPDPSEIALPLSKEMNERNLVEQDLNDHSSTIKRVAMDFMGPLIAKRLERSSMTYITQIKDFVTAEKERYSPFLVSFKPTSSYPFTETKLVLEESEWLKGKDIRNIFFHRKYEYQILERHISVFVSIRQRDQLQFGIAIDGPICNPLTTLMTNGIALKDCRFNPPIKYTLIDAVIRGVNTIHIIGKNYCDVMDFYITEINASGKSEKLEVVDRQCLPIMDIPLSLKDAEQRLKNFVLQCPDFNPQYVAFVPHLSIIACFNLNRTYDMNKTDEFYMAAPNCGFEKMIIHSGQVEGLYGYSYYLSPVREWYHHTVITINSYHNEISIHGIKTTQITNYPEIVTEVFNQLTKEIKVIISIPPLQNLIFEYLNLPNLAS